MKRASLLRVIAVAVFTLGNIIPVAAQTIFSEGFENGIPPTWTLLNVDGLTPNATVNFVNAAWVTTIDQEDTTNMTAVSTSWYDPVGTANDWLITPPITLTAGNGTMLKWRARAQDPDFADGYEVRISTTTPTVSGFNSNPALFSIAAENSNWQDRQYNLSAYTGQTVYLAFRNNTNDKFLLLIDSVRVEGIPDFDLSLDSVNILEYTIIPQAFTDSFNFSGLISNTGFNTATNVVLTSYAVDANGNILTYASSAPLPSLAVNASQILSTTLTLPDTGIYYFAHIISADSNLINANDTVWDYVYISDTVYGRDNDQTISSMGIGGGTGGTMGEVFEVVTPTDITSASFLLLQPQIGSTVTIVLYNFNGQPTTLLAATADTVIIDTGIQMFNLAFPAGTSLNPGTYLLGIVEAVGDSNLTIGVSNEKFTPGKLWAQAAAGGTWGTFESYGFYNPLLLRANFGNLVTVTCNDCVWPGDADANGVVDNDDILAIGVGYGNTGPVRANSSLLWVAQPAGNWPLQLVSGSNIKHIDTDGDGTILEDDTLAVYQNYSLTHLKGGQSGSPADPGLYFGAIPDTVSAGQTIQIPVYLGSNSLPVSNVYGIAFSINYDDALLEGSAADVNINTSWLGTAGSEVFSFTKDITGSSRTDIAITRKNHTDTTGYGQIGTISYTVKQNITGQPVLTLSLSGVKAITASETAVPLYADSTATVIIDSTVGIASYDAASLHIYPNPASTKLVVSATMQIKQVSILNTLGQAVQLVSGATGKNQEIDISNLAVGAYLLLAEGANGEITAKRFTISR